MNCFRENSRCGQIRRVIRSAAQPVDTGTIAAELGLCRHDVSRFLTRMRRMGYVVQESRPGIGRYATPARWRMVDGSALSAPSMEAAR